MDVDSDKIVVHLLREWRAGDPLAGERLVRKSYPPIYRYICRMVGGDEALAEDLTQVVFEAVVQRRSDIVSNFVAYVRTIARRTVIAHLRKKGNSIAYDPEVGDLADTTTGISSRLAKAQDASLLLEALRALTLERQEYLIWFYADNLSQEEIATRVGLTRAQVNGRINRARKALGKELRAQAVSMEQREALSGGIDMWARSLDRNDS